ncbi:phosphotransferase [Shewanella sp. CG12_big_fil_rev_8_21_14_0_65_47_15]|uniref:phosphotransferase n=1 Tax=Shewanella sp. CG12_big_fil_rev_8_21_14_0_65_47_15 TaxID=1975537 RepID=UPI000CCB1556|nr:phosphotransferase [Shewanella sp. CG12_big_fil_rev_8_21_14_0_65_47_15]PIW60437.1 MAG: aminoglycoside phosphotransferase [Shewanella sp. CG12_big_fil_rev_8_21_14_0_65_47_15]
MEQTLSEPFQKLLPILKAAGLDKITHISELSGGLSNHNYKISTPTADYVFRLNADAADSFCSRAQERFYWRHLANARLAPELLWVSEDERYYLSAFIESDTIEGNIIDANIDNYGQSHKHSLPWQALEGLCSAADFLQGQDSLHHLPLALEHDPLTDSHPNQAHRLLLTLLLQLRDIPKGPYGISITEQWQEYHQQMLTFMASSLIEGELSQIGGDWHRRVTQLLGIQADIQRWTGTLANCLLQAQFCHRDLNPHNLLLKDKRLYCIDFEYATASHPLCELATVLATHALTPLQQHFLVQQYLAKHPYLTEEAIFAVPAAIEMYWVLACYWALLMAAQQTEPSCHGEYIAWFDFFWPQIS